jgi:phage-related protein
VRCSKCKAVATKRRGKLYFLTRHERREMKVTWKGVQWQSINIEAHGSTETTETAQLSAAPPVSTEPPLSAEAIAGELGIELRPSPETEGGA